MKKLCVLLLSMIMAASLTVPAFAADGTKPEKFLFMPEAVNDSVTGVIGGADGPTAILTTGPLLGEFSWWTAEDEYLASHPGLAEQLRASAYDYFNANYSGYESAQEYMELNGMTEEEFLDQMVLAQAISLVEQELRQQSLDALKESLGGVAGQVGVMVNGRYVKFPDAAPEISGGCTMAPVRALVEALGGEVLYGDQKDLVRLYIDEYTIFVTIGSTTVEMMPRGTETGKENKSIQLDCAPYIKDGRAYVPVRFIAEALGYEVGWDSQFQTAILLDRGALAAEIDQDFTILNRALAASILPRVAGKTSRLDMKGSVSLTLFDTLNGNKTGRAGISSQQLMDSQSASGSYSIELSETLTDLLLDMDGLGPDQDDTIRTMLRCMEDVDFVMNREGLMWIHGPVLDEMSGEKNVWCGYDLGAELAGAIFAGTGRVTMGQLYAANLNCDSILSSGSASAGVEALAAIVGDGCFTTADGVSTLTVGLDELDPDHKGGLREQFKALELTLKVDGKGGVTAACTLETNASYGAPSAKLSLDYTLSGGKADMTMDAHVSNLCEVKLNLASTRQTTDEKPMTQPPAGAQVVDAPAPLAN